MHSQIRLVSVTNERMGSVKMRVQQNNKCKGFQVRFTHTPNNPLLGLGVIIEPLEVAPRKLLIETNSVRADGVERLHVYQKLRQEKQSERHECPKPTTVEIIRCTWARTRHADLVFHTDGA